MAKSVIKTFQKSLSGVGLAFFLFVGEKLIVAWFLVIIGLSVTPYSKVVLLSDKSF